jgi:hypothetical protein
MPSKSMLVCGCSFTTGAGLVNEKKDPKLWVNQLADKLGYNLTNIAEVGRNNDWIFLETLLKLAKNQNCYDLVVVAWSTLPRINVDLGLELWSTATKFDGGYEVRTTEKTFTKKWQLSIQDKLFEGYNFHWDFLKLVKYVNILKTQHNNIYFINTYGPWPNDYFVKKNIQLPSDLDDFTKQLLLVDNRDDKEIFDLYNLIHQQYSDAGGINEELWLNLYDNFKCNKLDRASETDGHPGYLSQDCYVEILLPSLKQKVQ